jgi:hypothetical protein
MAQVLLTDDLRREATTMIKRHDAHPGSMHHERAVCLFGQLT